MLRHDAFSSEWLKAAAQHVGADCMQTCLSRDLKQLQPGHIIDEHSIRRAAHTAKAGKERVRSSKITSWLRFIQSRGDDFMIPLVYNIYFNDSHNV